MENLEPRENTPPVQPIVITDGDPGKKDEDIIAEDNMFMDSLEYLGNEHERNLDGQIIPEKGNEESQDVVDSDETLAPTMSVGKSTVKKKQKSVAEEASEVLEFMNKSPRWADKVDENDVEELETANLDDDGDPIASKGEQWFLKTKRGEIPIDGSKQLSPKSNRSGIQRI